jgi:Transposase C of IS166 homeodomain
VYQATGEKIMYLHARGATEGTTTFVGPGTFHGFRRHVIELSPLRIIPYLNVSFPGPPRQSRRRPKRQKPARRPLPEHLPREELRHLRPIHGLHDSGNPRQPAPAYARERRSPVPCDASTCFAADFRTRLAHNKGPAIVNWGRGEEPAARRVTLLGLGNQ